MSQTLEEYLVGLKFNIDTTSLAKFNNAMSDVTKTMSKTVMDLGGDFAKLSFGITGALLTVGAASAKVASDFADFDQRMRLGALGAFMTKDAFTAMNESLKLAGVTLAQASWDPESHQRFLDGVQLIERLNKALGPDAEANARGIRDLKWQFSALGEELQYLSFAVGSDLFAKLFGNGDAQKALQRFNEWLINSIPQLADEISTDLVPILKDAWEITKDLGQVFKDAFEIFQNVVGVLSDDDTLTGTAVTFESVAKSVEHTVGWIDSLLKSIIHLEDALLHLDFSKLTGGDLAHLAELGLLTGSGRSLVWNLGKGLLGAGGAEAGAAAGGVALAPLAAVGAGAVGVYELYKHRDAVEAWNRKFLGMSALPTGNLVNLPPGLMEALVHQESGGHQTDKNGNTLTSSAGALGLTQLMPATARGLGVDPNDAQQNLRGGSTLLSQLLSRYHGNQAEALAAYNWGEGNLDKAIKAHGRFSMDFLPTETRNYVRNIEGRMGNSVASNGDVTVNVQVRTDANPQQIASVVKDVLNDHNAKQGRYGAAASVGYSQ